MKFTRLTVLVVVCFLLTFSLAFASSRFVTPEPGEIYNLGNTMIITGVISLPYDVDGATVTFNAYNSKLNERVQIAEKYYNFVNNVSTVFSQINKGPLTWTIPNDLETSEKWQIEVSVFKDKIPLKTQSSDNFIILNDLSSTVSVNKQVVKLGEPLILRGAVTDLRTNLINGNADITIKDSTGTIVYNNTSKIDNGDLFFTHLFKASNPDGDYTLYTKIVDDAGNTIEQTIGRISLNKKLSTTCIPQSLELSPGAPLIITGTLNDVHGNPVESANISTVVLTPDSGKLYISTQSDGNGNFGINNKMDKSAVPGLYSVTLNASDSFGNEGQCALDFEVTPVREVNAAFSLSELWAYANDTINVTLSAENLGNLDLNTTLSLYLDETKILEKTFPLGKSDIKTFVEPWVVEGESGDHFMSLYISYANTKLKVNEIQSFIILESLPEEGKFAALKNPYTLALVVFAILLIVLNFLKSTIIKILRKERPVSHSDDISPEKRDVSLQR